MKRIMMILIAMLIVGCTSGNDSLTKTEEIQTRCLDGVVYYLYSESLGYGGYGYMSPKYNRDGSVVLCGGGV